MSSNSQSPLFDSRLIIMIVAVTVFWIAWQSHLQKKYPEAYKPPAPAENTQQTGESAVIAGQPMTTQNTVEESVAQSTEAKEETVTFTSDIISFDITSRGMGLKNVNLKSYLTRDGRDTVLAKSEDAVLFSTTLNGQRNPVPFKIEKTGDFEYTGRSEFGAMRIIKIMQIDTKSYTVNTKVRVENAADNFTGFVTKIVEDLENYEGGFFLMPQFEHQEFVIRNDGSFTRDIVTPKENFSETYSKVHIAGFGSQYFAAAILDRSQVLPDFKALAIVSDNKGYGLLTHNVLTRADNFAIEYVSFVGPKSYELLKEIDPEMTGLINLGFFTSIAKAVLWLMKVLYSMLGNWGLAIIVLTIFVRILVLPFNLISYKQMKAMTTIQPQMKIIRERYKDDSNTMNQEIMKLMKESKANPLGGCLPMFLQIPVFFALYQVIGQSIELYQAPFIFWITDLSVKDHFYVLPVLMGLTMFLQQKITPTPMEPAQQKILMFLPIFFSLLMLTLPSGLTLYIFISSVFGVIQQYFFMKSNKVNIPISA